MKELSSWLQIISLDQALIDQAFDGLVTDFEDTIQYQLALTYSKTSAIVTGNIKNFKGAEIPVVLPKMAIKLI